MTLPQPPLGNTVVPRSTIPLDAAERAIIDRFHELYYRLGERGHNTIVASWLGYLVIKCPLDLWTYQELLVEYRPDLIIETGTAYGGSAMFLATMCDLIGHGRIISIDIDGSRAPTRPRHPRIAYVTGSSVDPDIVGDVVRQAAMIDRVIVILDSDHSKTHVLAELDAYAGLVRKGGYVIVEDTNVNGHPTVPDFGPGPMEAVDAFVADHPEFVIDRGFERFLLSFNPRGFLVRVA